MTRIVIWLLAFAGLSTQGATVAKSPPPPLSPNRYLFVVDTSSAMSVADANLRQSFFDLLHGGLNGQMLAGDTFGVWTFNEDVDTSYRMQIWDSKRNLELASRATFFLKNHRYEKKSRVNSALANATKVIQSARDVTVFLFSNGQEMLLGTPFDAEINDIYRKNYQELRKAKSPFLTTLVGRDGEIVAWSVVRAGEPFTLPLPPLPVVTVERLPEKTNAVVATLVTNAPRIIAPIIISRATTQPPPVPPAPSTAPVAVVVTTTNENAAAVAVAPGAQVGLTNVASKTPPPSETVAATSPPAPTPLPSIVPAQFTVSAREKGTITNPAADASSGVAAAVVTPPPILGPRAMLVVGLALFVAAVGLIVVLLRNFRASRQPSAITRSMQDFKRD